LGLVSLDGACEEQEEGKNQLLAVAIIVGFLLRNIFFCGLLYFFGGALVGVFGGFLGGLTGQRYTQRYTHRC
jgi:hypothetical protein